MSNSAWFYVYLYNKGECLLFVECHNENIDPSDIIQDLMADYKLNDYSCFGLSEGEKMAFFVKYCGKIETDLYLSCNNGNGVLFMPTN